jgi:hypothetical protein
MTKIQQVLEENEKEFNDEIKGIKIAIMTMDDDTAIPFIFNCLISQNLSSQLRLIEAFKEMIENNRKDTMIFDRPLTSGGGHPDFNAIPYNKALDDLLSELSKVVKENKER